jgi:hypothetical protein
MLISAARWRCRIMLLSFWVPSIDGRQQATDNPVTMHIESNLPDVA